MAPGLVETPSLPDQAFSYEKPSKAIFPDGLKTSGQFAPYYEQLEPYDAFPKHIQAPTVWKAEDYVHNPERWTHYLTETEIKEISEAADAYISSNLSLTAISKVGHVVETGCHAAADLSCQDKFPLPTMSKFLDAMKTELINGKGFIMFKGMPVLEFGNEKSAVAYMGLGTYLGYFVSQNGLGHVLGHVKDTGADPTQIDKVRIYRTTARQFFHTDDCDIVGLLCIARALEGGESDIVSTHAVWNDLQKEHPDVARLLTEPVWYFDRKGEVSHGQEEYTRQSIFYIERSAARRVYCKFDPYFVRSLKRFSDKGVIPPLSPKQERAIQVLEDTCNKHALHMILEVGDIQFLSNSHVLHARTAYKDYPAPAPRRHLMRLWLAVPEDEGGWSLPFADSKHKKRGGIQVNDTAPRAPTDAE